MLRLLLVSIAVAGTLAAAGVARADDCQFTENQNVDVNTGDGGWKPGLVLSVDPDLCGYTVRVLKQPGDDASDLYAGSYLEDSLRPNTLPLPYDKPYGCPFTANDIVDAKDDDGNWQRAAVVSADAQCNFTVAPINAANEVDTADAHAVFPSDIRSPTIAAPTEEQAAAARAAEICKSGETAANTTGTDPDSLMKHGVVADLDKKTGNINHVTFEQVQAGRTSIISDGGSFAADHPDAVIGDNVMPYRIRVSVCTDGEAQLPPLRFDFDYRCYANAFGEGICEATASQQLK